MFAFFPFSSTSNKDINTTQSILAEKEEQYQLLLQNPSLHPVTLGLQGLVARPVRSATGDPQSLPATASVFPDSGASSEFSRPRTGLPPLTSAAVSRPLSTNRGRSPERSGNSPRSSSIPRPPSNRGTTSPAPPSVTPPPKPESRSVSPHPPPLPREESDEKKEKSTRFRSPCQLSTDSSANEQEKPDVVKKEKMSKAPHLELLFDPDAVCSSGELTDNHDRPPTWRARHIPNPPPPPPRRPLPRRPPTGPPPRATQRATPHTNFYTNDYANTTLLTARLEMHERSKLIDRIQDECIKVLKRVDHENYLQYTSFVTEMTASLDEVGRMMVDIQEKMLNQESEMLKRKHRHENELRLALQQFGEENGI